MISARLAAVFERRKGPWLTATVCCLLLAASPLAAQWEDGPGEVPYVPTPPEVVNAMLKLAAVQKGEVMFDLGCGDGRIVIAAAKNYGARGTGVDINPERIKEAEENARQAGVTAQVKFVEKNLFDADFHEANVVTLYLLPDVNLRLRPKLVSELKTGSRIVSHDFDMGDWKPEKKVELDHHRVYLWTVTEQAKKDYGGSAAQATGKD